MNEEENNESDDEARREIKLKIISPIFWDGPVFCKIQDICQDHYNDVLRLIKHHYFREDQVCKLFELAKDPESIEEYLNLIKVWMNDTTSFIATSALSGRIIGIVVARIISFIDKTNTFTRIQHVKGRAIGKIMDLTSDILRQANAFTNFQQAEYLHIFLLCTHPSYKEKNLESVLLKTTIELATSLKLLALGSIFTSIESQSIAKNLGFRTFVKIFYNQWINNDLLLKNQAAEFMGLLI